MPRERGCQRSSGRHSRTAHAELSSMSHMEHLLREGHYAQCLSSSAPIFLASIMQHLTAKVLELAGNVAQNSGQRHITPELAVMAVHHSTLLNGSFGMTTISLVAPARH
ncbi:histone H2A-Bbd type 2/3-like [Moschus berezovskii]|uniref:histone H2A-Bbd type 2/3-like n=1 Tax=Moschus berezovskii TaxID=68408 RepID=UPI0024447B91|nr:histone H2A-Bbd type 2/3-like [Moschus berezovskii]